MESAIAAAAEPARTSKYGWRVVLFSGAGWFFDGYVINVWPLAIPFVMIDLHLSVTDIGTITTLYVTAYMLGTLLGGTFADYLGPRSVLSFSVLFYMFVDALTAVAQGFWSLGFFRFMTGTGTGMELPVGSTFIPLYLVKVRQIPTPVELTWLATYQVWAVAITYLGAWLSDRWGRRPFAIMFAALTLVAVWGMTLVPSGAPLYLAGALVFGFNNATWTISFAHSTELYPTHIRGSGIGTTMACGRVVSILAPLFFGLVAARYGIAVAFRLGALAWILTIIGYLLSRETSGIALERIEEEAALATARPAAAPLALHDLVRSGRANDPGGRRFHRRRLCLLGFGLPALGCDLPRRGDRAAAAHDGVERVGSAQNPRRKCAPLSESGGVIATTASERKGDPHP